MLYKDFSQEQISEKISSILKGEMISSEVEIIFQSIEGLHKACPNHKGDWYFTGDYPTPGGSRIANNAFINYYEGKSQRAY
jgi:amidophosphoribosyltransferase